ncbi:MAG: c-type cytochrome [Anaerolineales bacterium]
MKNILKLETYLGILATALIVIGLFLVVFNEPKRIASAQQSQLASDLDEAMTLYAQNCSVCHGLAGEGIGATPPLNNEALRQTDYDSLYKIIARGLYNTAMPAWSKEDGGPLSDYQISEMVTLIQNGDWQKTQDRVVNLGLAPSVPFTTQPDSTALAQIAQLPQGDLLTRGVELYSQQCVACHGADGKGTAIAPALNDPVVRQKSSAELERIIRTGVAGTLMAGWENKLNNDDVSALVALITQWDQIPQDAIPAPDKPVAVTQESLALGSDLYAQNCSRCHGADGQGTRRAPSLNVKGYLETTNDAALQQIITLGVPGTAMPAWGDRLSDAEIQAIVGFIRSWQPTAPEVAEPARGGGGPWWQTGGTNPNNQGGRPPWLRNNAAPSPNSPALPSGDSNPNAPNQANVSGSPKIGQGQPASGQTHSSDNQNSQPGGHGAPYSPINQLPSQPSTVDWRTIALIGGIFLSSSILIGLGLRGTRKAL